MQKAAGVKKTLASLCGAAIDVILPPRCVATGEIVDAQGTVSPSFWPSLQFIEEPCCVTCGIPFSFSATAGMLCAACIEREPLFDRSRSATVYNDASRKMILSFKYGDRLHAVHTFVPWMMRAGKEMVERADIILPVLLHYRRLWERRFNQSALLACEIGKRSGKSYLPDGLLRTRHTLPQQGLNFKERGKNVRGAFSVNPLHLPRLKKRNILLVDDVFTSGATLNECARVLKAAEAARVDVLTIARVTREEFNN
jgi:ComF family protein